MIKAKWSGKYPCLCSGEWSLEIDGRDVSDCIPKEIRNRPMYTYGIYRTWRFDEKWTEYYEDYVDGLDEIDWINGNDYWLKMITDDIEIKNGIFKAMQQHDFRENSCGGCI